MKYMQPTKVWCQVFSTKFGLGKQFSAYIFPVLHVHENLCSACGKMGQKSDLNQITFWTRSNQQFYNGIFLLLHIFLIYFLDNLVNHEFLLEEFLVSLLFVKLLLFKLFLKLLLIPHLNVKLEKSNIITLLGILGLLENRFDNLSPCGFRITELINGYESYPGNSHLLVALSYTCA